jgi:hypothetical protein
MLSDKAYNDLLEALDWAWVEDSVMAKSRTYQGCDPACPGWVVSDQNRGMGRIVEKCDDCAVFQHDENAMDHAVKLLGAAMMARHYTEVKGQEDEPRGTQRVQPRTRTC